ncbi:MAG TPA: nitroreductase family protein [Bacteroidales bacterium]
MGFINVNSDKCTKCNTCIASCPVACISSDSASKLPVIKPEKEALCVYCGHCESICPEGALVHSLSQQALQSAKEQSKHVNAADLALYFKQRRSIRNFKKEVVDKQLLEQAFDVVRFAPTGHNRQKNQWIVVYDTKVVEAIAAATIDWMRGVVKANPEMGTRYGFPGLVIAFDRGRNLISRNAPHLIICYTPASHPVGPKDAVIATTQMDLYLPSLGVGTCWAGFIYMALQQSDELKKIVGLDENSAVHAALLIGYPKYNYHKIPHRKAADVKWI